MAVSGLQYSRSPRFWCTNVTSWVRVESTVTHGVNTACLLYRTGPKSENRGQEYGKIYKVSREECATLREMFLKLKYTDLTKNTYIQSWTVTEIMVREKCGLLAVPPTLLGSRDVLPYTAHVRPSVYSRVKRTHTATAHVKCLEP